MNAAQPASSSNPPQALVGVRWDGGLDDGCLVILDQTRLPVAVSYLRLTTLEGVRQAILDLAVRGAPAIGIAGAYGLVLHLIASVREHGHDLAPEQLSAALEHGSERLVSSRPTAVNLRWAVERLVACYHRHAGHLTALETCARLLMEARRVQREDQELCRRIAENGAPLLPSNATTYTHCNTGALATGGVGTALGCLVEAHRRGRGIAVIAGETRPLLQGARLTALELGHAGVPVTLCIDSAAASLMARGKVQAVIVGADRICANGDTANKIGTYSLAVLARHHRIPFYVAAPYSTFDLALADGSLIHIEERGADEVRRPQGAQAAPAEVAVTNPAFDVTPADLISAIITERGVIERPDAAKIKAMMDQPGESVPAV
jgi:methylthioribose-1-phosphate isomerase